MAITSINVGNIPNDGTGDDLREAFIKVNNNFAEVDSRLTSVPVNGENLGTGGEGIYAGKLDSDLQFKSLVAGSNVTLTSTGSSITIDAAGGLDSLLVVSDNGSCNVINSTYLGINGGDVITSRVSGTNVILDLDNTGIVAHDTNPTLSAHFDANDFNIQNGATISANNFIGSVTGLVHGVDIRDINRYFDNYWEFGEMIDDTSYTSIIDFIIGNTEVDLGPIAGAGVLTSTIDLGAF